MWQVQACLDQAGVQPFDDLRRHLKIGPERDRITREKQRLPACLLQRNAGDRGMTERCLGDGQGGVALAAVHPAQIGVVARDRRSNRAPEPRSRGTGPVPLDLGISLGGSLLKALGFVVAIITYGTDRTNLPSGIVHLVLLAT